MSKALDRAITICVRQTELARRIGGKTRTGHIYYWRANGVPPDVAPKIEAATGGKVRCEELCPAVEWTRDKAGRITGYHTAIEQAA